MDIRKLSWTRGLALLLAILMVMMYSVSGSVFAGNGNGNAGEFQIHYKGDKQIVFHVQFSYTSGGAIINFSDDAEHSSGVNYDGDLGPGFPSQLSNSTIKEGMTITAELDDVIFEVSDFTLSGEGNGVLNIKVLAVKGVPPYMDLEVTKTVNNTSVGLGDEVLYTIVVENLGTEVANDVYVEDIWPSEGLSQGGFILPKNATVSGSGVLIPNIDPDKSKTIKITGEAISLGTWTNTANVTLTSDTAIDNNTSAVNVTVIPDYDVSIKKTVNDKKVNIGDEVTFKIVVENLGAKAAKDVYVEDIWPSDGFSQGGFNLPVNATVSGSGVLIPNINPDKIKTITITGEAISAGTWENIANVTLTSDTAIDNNTSSVEVTVKPQYDISVEKTVNNSSVGLGDEVLYTIVVKNLGSEAAKNVYVEDIWPSNGFLQGDFNLPGNATVSGSGVVITNINPDKTKIITITGKAIMVGTWNNKAEIDFTSDTAIDNNTYSVEVTVTLLDPTPQYNLWVASDDYAEVYIDGGPSPTTNDSSYQTASKYLKPVTDDTFVAAKAWDTNGIANIAGFKLVLQKNDASGYLTTDSTWYYYYKTVDGISSEPPVDGNKKWYDKEYSGEGWLPVTCITGSAIDPFWAPDANFPTMATWIWSPNFDYPKANPMDSPIYLRSLPPQEPNAPETFTVTYAPGAHGTFEPDVTTELALGADTPAAPTDPQGDQYWYFTEWDPTPIATVAGITVYTAQWTYDGPETPTTPTRRTTPVITPIVDEPVALVETPIVDEPVALAADPNVPQTNDSNNILLLLSLMFASGLGIVTIGRRKENAGK